MVNWDDMTSTRTDLGGSNSATDSTSGFDVYYPTYSSNVSVTSVGIADDPKYSFDGRGFKTLKEMIDYQSKIFGIEGMLELRFLHDQHKYVNAPYIEDYPSKHRKVIEFDYYNKWKMQKQKIWAN